MYVWQTNTYLPSLLVYCVFRKKMFILRANSYFFLHSFVSTMKITPFVHYMILFESNNVIKQVKWKSCCCRCCCVLFHVDSCVGKHDVCTALIKSLPKMRSFDGVTFSLDSPSIVLIVEVRVYAHLPMWCTFACLFAFAYFVCLYLGVQLCVPSHVHERDGEWYSESKIWRLFNWLSREWRGCSLMNGTFLLIDVLHLFHSASASLSQNLKCDIFSSWISAPFSFASFIPYFKRLSIIYRSLQKINFVLLQQS